MKNLYIQDGDHLSAGGSSGGSAVAVATGQCDAYVFEANLDHLSSLLLEHWEPILEDPYAFQLLVLAL